MKTPKNKHNLPVFESEDDLIRAFERKQKSDIEKDDLKTKQVHKNRHGLPVLKPAGNDFQEKETEENFAELLEESLTQSRDKKRVQHKPIPVKKRLKRYPPPELELDLHGFTAIGAQVKAGSFISSAKQQGFFTVRIIVGKGLHSEMGPVLPDVIEDTVRELKQQGLVLSFRWERKKKSASGAMIVYIKQFDKYD